MKIKPFYKDEVVKIYNADSRDMSVIPNESVGLIVTSPPYWDLKNYNHKSQVGLGQSYTGYLQELEKIIKESKRVLEPGRYFAMVIGTRVSDGDLKHIPFDAINIFQKIGFILKKEFIWLKPKGTQGLWQRGTTRFLKKEPYAGAACINIQHEFIHLFQKPGEFRNGDRQFLTEEFIKSVAWSVWEMSVSKQKGHPAPFPYELPKRIIKLYSTKGDTILDPFLGSGTTALAAKDLKRKCIGFEISKEYCQMAQDNLESRLI